MLHLQNSFCPVHNFSILFEELQKYAYYDFWMLASFCFCKLDYTQFFLSPFKRLQEFVYYCEAMFSLLIVYSNCNFLLAMERKEVSLLRLPGLFLQELQKFVYTGFQRHVWKWQKRGVEHRHKPGRQLLPFRENFFQVLAFGLSWVWST